MIKYIWAAMIVIGVAAGIATGGAEAVSDAVLSGAKDAAELCLSMIGVYALWLGILNIADASGIIKSITKIAEKPVSKLFSGIKRGSQTVAYITMNLVANMLGMGNAATPFGLKAMDELQKENPHPETATHDMCTFIILNTASVQLLPLSIIAVRSAAGSKSPADIVLTSFIATLFTAVFGVTLGKIIAARQKKKCRR